MITRRPVEQKGPVVEMILAQIMAAMAPIIASTVSDKEYVIHQEKVLKILNRDLVWMDGRKPRAKKEKGNDGKN